MTIFDVGDKPEVTVTFTSTSGTLTTPTGIVVKTLAPDGTKTTITAPDASIVTVSTGVVRYTFPTLADPGPWAFRMEGTGMIVAAVGLSFTVRAAGL